MSVSYFTIIHEENLLSSLLQFITCSCSHSCSNKTLNQMQTPAHHILSVLSHCLLLAESTTKQCSHTFLLYSSYYPTDTSTSDQRAKIPVVQFRQAMCILQHLIKTQFQNLLLSCAWENYGHQIQGTKQLSLKEKSNVFKDAKCPSKWSTNESLVWDLIK